MFLLGPCGSVGKLIGIFHIYHWSHWDSVFSGCNAPGGRILHIRNTRKGRPLEFRRHVQEGGSVLEVKCWKLH